MFSFIKNFLPHSSRVFLGRLSRRFRYGVIFLSRFGARDKFCSVCSHNHAGFIHGGIICSFCGSFPRHRALWPLLNHWINNAPGVVSTLLVAPDACLRARLLEITSIQYTGVDMFAPGHYYPSDTLHGDLTHLQFNSNAFDLVICLHVLEHVDNDRNALDEIFRVLTPGGLALICFPFRSGAKTYEDISITDHNERATAFGQWDHVRIYGEDVVDRMVNARFQVTKLLAKDFNVDINLIQWGLIPNEVFFVCRKLGNKSSLSGVKSNQVPL